MATASRYRLDQLGWLSFQALAAAVLTAETGLNDLHWRGAADVGRLAVVGGDVRLPDRSPLRGPVSVLVIWVRQELSDEARQAAFVDAMTGSAVEFDADLLVLTNLETPLAIQALEEPPIVALGHVVVLGPGEIGASLDRHPSLRAALPSVLGATNLGELIDDEIATRSSLDVGRAQALAGVFWPTRAYDHALAVLRTHGFVVLTGPPEMGKTAIAQMIALALMTDGWEAHECSDPVQVWQAFDPGRRQVFVADDAFGSTEYRPDAGERWATGLGRLLRMLDPQHWLIWTSRPAPLKAGLRRLQRDDGAARFPSPGEVLVDASELDLAEKTLILFRHAKGQAPTGIARDAVRWLGVGIVEHPHFTPERIRRFVTGRLDELGSVSPLEDPSGLRQIVARELASPTEAMRTSFNALQAEHRDLLIALLDAPAGLIDERELTETIRRHHAGGLSRPPGELIDRLTDHFLRVTPLGIGWVHPSWRDLVIEQLAGDAPARRRFLAASGIDGLMLALSHAGGTAGERQLPLMLSDGDWDALGDAGHQLLHQGDVHDVARLLIALSGAVDGAPSGAASDRQRREAVTLAATSLNTVKRNWDEHPEPIPLFLLDAWFTLNATAGDLLDPPDLGPTWIELHPGRMFSGPLTRTDLARVEDWLALAELLRRHARDELRRFDFHGRDKYLISDALPALADAASHPELHDTAETVLMLIEGMLPELRMGTRGAIEIGRSAEGVEAGRWWIPDDLARPPSDELLSTEAFGSAEVHRVLRDL
jgi:hypothetical protein